MVKSDSHNRENGIKKSRYWNGILYPENMRPDWREVIADELQLPGSYCIHDKDKDGEGEMRKEHVHVFLAHPNTTTLKHAKAVFNVLSLPGKVCCPTVQAAISTRHSYEYLIHNTEGAKKAGKHQYSPDERIDFNGFDIGFYEVVSAKEKHEMVFELSILIDERGIENMRVLFQVVRKEYDFRHFECMLSNNAYFDRLCRGVYLDGSNGKHESTAAGMMDAARIALADIIARTGDGTRVAVCEECGEVKSVDEFVSYGGRDSLNIGICRECSKKN